MRVFVELSQDVDAASWGTRHAAGIAADSTPYGLHHLGGFGHRVRFSRALAEGPTRRVSEAVASRLWGLQPVTTAVRSWTRERRGADVVLCMDERNGVPVALTSTRLPVVAGIAWIEDPTAMSPVHRALAKAALDRAAGVFVECRAMIEPLVHDFGVSANKVHFVTLGIDEQHFTPPVHDAVADRVFSVGDDRMRDYATLGAALRRVHARRPGTTAEIATTLPVELPAEWTVIHRRRMDHAVKECYQRAALVALALAPTRQGSGLTVILEAMASARPLVVTDNPGLSDYVEHGVTGLLVPAGDPEAMADAISGLLADPDRAAAMGREGRRRVEQRFTTRHMAVDLDRVLRAAMSG